MSYGRLLSSIAFLMILLDGFCLTFKSFLKSESFMDGKGSLAFLDLDLNVMTFYSLMELLSMMFSGYILTLQPGQSFKP